MAPIKPGEFPSFASLAIRPSISSGVYFNQAGGFLLTGRVDPDRPRLLVYSLAKSDTLRACTLIPDFGIRPSLLYLSRSRRQLRWFREVSLAIGVSY